jgi:transcriptional regulator with XRE-family HTH domain
MATMGERLKAARKRVGMTQVDLAARTGVGLATIRRVEQEVMEPRMGTTRKLAAALGANESWLAYGVGDEMIEKEDWA